MPRYLFVHQNFPGQFPHVGRALAARGDTVVDSLDGGAGIDTADYTSASAAISANLSTGLSSGADGIDTLISIETSPAVHLPTPCWATQRPTPSPAEQELTRQAGHLGVRLCEPGQCQGGDGGVWR